MLFISVVLVNMLVMDGKGNYMEGLMLLTLYIVIALSCEYNVQRCVTELTVIYSLGVINSYTLCCWQPMSIEASPPG